MNLVSRQAQLYLAADLVLGRKPLLDALMLLLPQPQFTRTPVSSALIVL